MTHSLRRYYFVLFCSLDGKYTTMFKTKEINPFGGSDGIHPPRKEDLHVILEARGMNAPVTIVLPVKKEPCFDISQRGRQDKTMLARREIRLGYSIIHSDWQSRQYY
jgi:hypothetical protein